jgi:hypothetical protein
VTDDYCEARYEFESQGILDRVPGLDRAPVACLREGGHRGSHIAQRSAHVSIWDDEMFFDFYAPDGFSGSTQTPINHQSRG